jgi:heterodisulfide reductase subunit C
LSVINFKFRNEVLKHNASLSYCYQCSTCSSGCPVALFTEGLYNPRKIIEEALLGFEDKLIDRVAPDVWLCSTCQKCVELCPQKVELTEIFTLIKNRSFERGKVPQSFLQQGQAVLENGIAIPYSNAIISRRKKLGLPEIQTAPVEEIKSLLKETNFEKHITEGLKANEL